MQTGTVDRGKDVTFAWTHVELANARAAWNTPG
jgi:hypothetical protein